MNTFSFGTRALRSILDTPEKKEQLTELVKELFTDELTADKCIRVCNIISEWHEWLLPLSIRAIIRGNNANMRPLRGTIDPSTAEKLRKLLHSVYTAKKWFIQKYWKEAWNTIKTGTKTPPEPIMESVQVPVIHTKYYELISAWLSHELAWKLARWELDTKFWSTVRKGSKNKSLKNMF